MQASCGHFGDFAVSRADRLNHVRYAGLDRVYGAASFALKEPLQEMELQTILYCLRLRMSLGVMDEEMKR